MPIDECSYYLSEEKIENMKMVNDRVLVEVFDNRSRTESGISIPITQDNPFVPDRGVVFACMQDKPFKKGTLVIIKECMGRRILCKDNDRQFILLKEEHILAIIEE